ncbi:hypothetical protein MiSe_45100 [Microseira wollei NIES-4236]|uniref:PEP-CTERM protein-sorting domain-containing protein n=2 Tax=Microseira wollei TaxID=467598 RepID=A0AAV3XC08_9CYAN|nr:hypothetical protein MiSe_45100 [Microseira wollei NIES-4236]
MVLSSVSTARAALFTMFYDVQQTNGKYLYDFDLTQTDTVSPDTTLNWIVFFDKPWLPPYTSQPNSDIINAQLVGSAPAPFTDLTSSGGGHNGPTFLDTSLCFPNNCDLNSTGWKPTGIGDKLSWKILADNLVTDIKWTNLHGSGDSQNNVMHDAVQKTAVPEPFSIFGLIAIGALGVGSLRKRQ